MIKNKIHNINGDNVRRILRLYKDLKERHFTTMAGAIAFFVIVNCGSLFFIFLILKYQVKVYLLMIFLLIF